MKLDKDLTTKMSLRHFINLVSRGLICNWSMHYNPTENPNVKTFANIPDIETKDYLKAYDYTQLNKVIALEQPDKSTIFFTPSSKYSGPFDKNICRTLFDKINNCDFDTFDQLIKTHDDIHIVKMNDKEWK